MAVITAAAGGGNWSATGTWTGAVVPTAADDVQLGAGSGNVTIDAAAVARSLDCTGYTGTLTHAAAVTLTLGDAAAGAGSNALTLVSGMTYTLGNAATSAIVFASTSATQQSVTTGGKTLGNWTINGAGSSYLLADANTVGTGATVSVAAGALNTGGVACSWGAFASNTTSTRSVTFGTSTVTITGNATSFDTIPSTGLTWSAASSTVNLNGAANYMRSTVTLGTVNWNAVGQGAQTQPFTCTNLTITGSAAKVTDFVLIGTITVTGALTLAGNSEINRLKVRATVPGVRQTISAGTVTVSNTDLQDITGAGAGSWNLSATAGGSGDCGNNTGITFTSPAAQTHTASAGGNWSDVTKWSSRVPLPQDDVIVDAGTTGTITADMPRLGRSIDFTGFAGTAAFSSTANQVFGSLTLASGMTVSGTQTLTLGGRGTYRITSAGKSFTQALTLAAFSGTYTLADALTTPGALTISSGVLVTGGNPLSYGSLTVTAGVLVTGGGMFSAFF